MGGKNRAPAPPDMSQIAAASERAAELNFQISREQLAWAREQYGQDSEIISRIVDDNLARMEVNDAAAARDRERYERIYQPLEDQAAADAESYGSQERQDYEAGRASAQVADQFETARRAATQNLESFGVDPSSTRFAALDLGTRVQQAAAQAGAANQARTQTEAIGRSLRSEAINVGRGYPGQIAGTYGTALQSGNSGANSQLAGTASGASTMGTGTQWGQMGTNNLNTWGNTINQGYANQMAQYNANQQSSSGLGSILGAGLGIAANSGFALEDGGAIPDGQATTGGAVPMSASPSGGKAIDDVNAKVNAGEFVVPTDVVKWLGEKHFQQMIEKSRKEKPQAPAQPKRAMIPPGATPAFASRPMAAIPMG